MIPRRSLLTAGLAGLATTAAATARAQDAAPPAADSYGPRDDPEDAYPDFLLSPVPLTPPPPGPRHLKFRHLHTGENLEVVYWEDGKYVWDALGAIVGLPAERAIRALFLVYVTGLSFLLIGFHSRVAAVTVWFSHFLLKLNLGYSSSYGVDTFSHIALFYLMFMPMNRVWSMDALMGRVQGDAGVAQRVSLRIFQLHLFLIYFSTGIEKILGWQWRTGEVMWRAWMMPQFQVYDMTWLAWYPWLAKALAWGTLFLEIGYPLLLGIPRTRKLAARGIISLHLGIALTMHLWTFSSVMITLTACAFLVPAEPAPEKRTADLPGRVQADVLVMT